MSSKIDWTSLVIAILCGVGVGIAVPFIAHYFGMPRAYAAPITGGIAGALVPLIYRLRTRGRSDHGA